MSEAPRAALLLAFATACTPTPASVSLSDTTLDDWILRGPARYTLTDGTIVGEAVPNSPNSFLCTRRTYRDFVLELEFRVDEGLNSGVQIRSAVRPTEGGGERVYGYQVEIDPSPRAWTGGIYDEARRGWLADLSTNEPARRAFRPGDWNTLRIEAKGPRIRTWLNGTPAADLEDPTNAEGFIALQVHGVGALPHPLHVEWRSLRLTE